MIRGESAPPRLLVAALAPAPRACTKDRRVVTSTRQTGGVPSRADLATAAGAVRKIVVRTAELPDDAPADELLRERLTLAADVLDAAAGRAAR